VVIPAPLISTIAALADAIRPPLRCMAAATAPAPFFCTVAIPPSRRKRPPLPCVADLAALRRYKYIRKHTFSQVGKQTFCEALTFWCIYDTHLTIATAYCQSSHFSNRITKGYYTNYSFEI